jgi:hypothetical protein
MARETKFTFLLNAWGALRAGLGPWHMLAGSYDEPIAGDENPETCELPTSASAMH